MRCVDRFIGMLDGFRKDSQFIVVTHNKATMTAAEALYGVTMEVKGVSRFVSVELAEVDSFAPGASGSTGDTGGDDPEPTVELQPQKSRRKKPTVDAEPEQPLSEQAVSEQTAGEPA